MKNVLKMGLLTLCLAACQTPTNKFESINAEDFAKVITTETVQVLDVRTAEEYAAGHIANSKNIDVKLDDFTARINQELNKDQKVAVYCRSGRRSKQAADQLVNAGFKVVELNGGFNEWKECQQAIEK